MSESLPFPKKPTLTSVFIGNASNGYTFPDIIGSPSEILQVPTTGNELIWIPNSGGGGGDIINGGQTGAVTLGSNDNKLTLIGSTGIKLQGGLDIQYDKIENNGSNTFTLTDAHQFVEIVDNAVTLVQLPESETRQGKQYIISKGYSGGNLTITTTPTDKIDGDDTIILNVINQRISIISSGDDRWLIV
jgi:hypothetical protein